MAQKVAIENIFYEKFYVAKKYEDALKSEQLFLKAAADNEDFYRRQKLFAAGGGGATLAVGLLIVILSFIGRSEKVQTLSIQNSIQLLLDHRYLRDGSDFGI